MAQKDNAVSIGVKGGINMPRMHYVNNKHLSSLPQAWKITPMGGVFVDIPIGDVFVIAPEFDYVQRGTDITYEHISGMQVHYAMSVAFVDFRIPFEFQSEKSARAWSVLQSEVLHKDFSQASRGRVRGKGNPPFNPSGE